MSQRISSKNESMVEELKLSEAVGPNTKRQAVTSVALTDAVAKDNLSPWSSSMIKLYGIMTIVTLNDVMNGYDGSLMGSINAMDPYHDYFGVGMQGSGTGIVFSIYSIGNLVGALFAATACDKLGRRFGMFAGAASITIGTITQATSPSIGQFMGGRFLIGFGVSMATTAAPTYLVEMAYPPWRGLWGGLYNVCGYYIGAIVCTWTTYGTGHMTSNWSWRIPVILQAVPSVIIMLLVYFMPESPRWLWQQNKIQKAKDVLIKHHGDGNPRSAVVALECDEIDASVNQAFETADKRWWDYRCLFNSRGMLLRMWLIFLVTTFQQFIGGSVISYYLPVMLENAGITETNQQLLLSALNTVFSFISGLVGSFMVDRLGRRNMFLWTTFLTGLCYIPINVIAAKAEGHVGVGGGYAFIAFIYLYGIIISFGWTPLQALYPAEILTNEVRAKGMAFQGFVAGLANFINLYATPVALNNIGWKMYTIFLVLHFLEWVFMYFSVVETKGRSLEELEDIFNDRRPVKRSLQKTEIILKTGEGVKVEIDQSA